MKLSNDLNNAKKLLGLAEEKCLKLQLEIEHRDQLNHDLRYKLYTDTHNYRT